MNFDLNGISCFRLEDPVLTVATSSSDKKGEAEGNGEGALELGTDVADVSLSMSSVYWSSLSAGERARGLLRTFL